MSPCNGQCQAGREALPGANLNVVIFLDTMNLLIVAYVGWQYWL